jgi:integrase
MYEFSLTREPIFRPFIQYRMASDRWNTVSNKNLLYFDRYCSEQYPDNGGISQQMVDGWCKKRETERNGSCYTRTLVVVSLIHYLRERGLTDIHLPMVPIREKRTYIPHAFTQEELHRFFCECDRRVAKARTAHRAARAMIASVIFRLLYSSGLRTVEARLLRVENVDLGHGVLDIQYSKGRDQHYVVLHDSMLTILRYYDAAIRRVFPERIHFFPGNSEQPLFQEWIPLAFRPIWDSVNDSHAVPYDLRHNYATANINRWVNDGFVFHDKFIYLSKSMGHKQLESTKYYYSMVPALSDILNDKTVEGFNEIVPGVDEDE